MRVRLKTVKFKLFGTEVYISFLFAAVIAFMLATDRTGLVIPTIFAVFIHEAGHLLAMWAADCAPRRIRLIPASVQIVRSFSAKPYAETAITVCGPVANLVVFFALYINYLVFGRQDILVFGMLNLIIGAFNLLPVSGLDGGTLLCLLLSKFLSSDKAQATVRIITVVFGFAALIVGLYLAFSGRLNLSVFIVALYLFVASIMKM